MKKQKTIFSFKYPAEQECFHCGVISTILVMCSDENATYAKRLASHVDESVKWYRSSLWHLYRNGKTTKYIKSVASEEEAIQFVATGAL